MKFSILYKEYSADCKLNNLEIKIWTYDTEWNLEIIYGKNQKPMQ